MNDVHWNYNAMNDLNANPHNDFCGNIENGTYSKTNSKSETHISSDSLDVETDRQNAIYGTCSGLILPGVLAVCTAIRAAAIAAIASAS